MLYKHLIEGGIWFMLPIYLLAIGIILLSGMQAYQRAQIKTTKPANYAKRTEAILFLGSLAFLWGLLGQITGMMQMLGILSEFSDISPSLIAGGIKVSLLAPLYGFVIFIFSAVVWFVFRISQK
ncbi:MAG: MotA/TolQ/ExbB proton channel family protein [Lentimicrobiaceae bacterium]|nr:MotA/TolQ/ExbB proton channel family protein [Lentimicrobiaceae bacterium]